MSEGQSPKQIWRRRRRRSRIRTVKETPAHQLLKRSFKRHLFLFLADTQIHYNCFSTGPCLSLFCFTSKTQKSVIHPTPGTPSSLRWCAHRSVVEGGNGAESVAQPERPGEVCTTQLSREPSVVPRNPSVRTTFSVAALFSAWRGVDLGSMKYKLEAHAVYGAFCISFKKRLTILFIVRKTSKSQRGIKILSKIATDIQPFPFSNQICWPAGPPFRFLLLQILIAWVDHREFRSDCQSLVSV